MPLLSLLSAKDAFYGALVLGLAIAFGVYTIHERHIGEAHEAAAVAKATAALEADTAKQTAELKAKAQMEHDTYEKEILALSNQPAVEPVRLCHAAGSRPIVPAASAVDAGNGATGSAAGNVLAVPAGNSGSGQPGAGPDISSLLGLLALRADEVSASLREFQGRE
jgi:hypothetical protein